MRHRSSVAIVTLGLAFGPLVGVAAGQESPRVVMEGAAGWVGFADDGIVGEPLVGGSARLYVRPGLSVGPEIVYLAGDNHQHLMLTGNLTWDLVLGRSLTPFLLMGGGLFQTRESFPTGAYTSREGAFTAGGGVRAGLGEAVLVGVEARIGWEAHIRINGFIGLRLWR